MPSVARRALIDVGAGDEPVHRAQAVVDHHAPEHLALPQHGLEHVAFGGVAALAEDPVVDGQGDVAEVGQDFRVRHRLQVAAALDQFLLADRVAAAVRVVEEHGRSPPGQRARPRDIRRHRFDAVEIQRPRLEDVAVPFVFSRSWPADRPLSIRQVAHQRVELGPPTVRRRRGGLQRFSSSPSKEHGWRQASELQHVPSRDQRFRHTPMIRQAGGTGFGDIVTR